MRIVTRIAVVAIAAVVVIAAVAAIAITGSDEAENPSESLSDPVETGGSSTAPESGTVTPATSGESVAVLSYDRCTYLGTRVRPPRFTLYIENWSPFDTDVTVGSLDTHGSTPDDVRAWARNRRYPGEPPWKYEIGVEVPAGGKTQLALNLQPGVHMIICGQHDPTTPQDWRPRAIYVATGFTVR